MNCMTTAWCATCFIRASFYTTEKKKLFCFFHKHLYTNVLYVVGAKVAALRYKMVISVSKEELISGRKQNKNVLNITCLS